MSKHQPARLTSDEQRQVAEAESRLDEHLKVVEDAYGEGRLAEAISDMPPVREQLQALRDTSAYTIWGLRHRPSAEEKGLVVNWLAEREALGPPEDATADDKQNYTARAGERQFYFRRFDLPDQDPVGYMLIMEIR